MNGRRDAHLRVGELIPIAMGSQIRGQSNSANHSARDGQPYEVDGNLSHAIPLSNGRDNLWRMSDKA